MIEADEFREDLLFRLNTFEIHLPPLRDRKTDIVELARHLLARSAKRPLEQVADLLTGEAIEVLLRSPLGRQCPRVGQRHGIRLHRCRGRADHCRPFTPDRFV